MNGGAADGVVGLAVDSHVVKEYVAYGGGSEPGQGSAANGGVGGPVLAEEYRGLLAGHRGTGGSDGYSSSSDYSDGDVAGDLESQTPGARLMLPSLPQPQPPPPPPPLLLLPAIGFEPPLLSTHISST